MTIKFIILPYKHDVDLIQDILHQPLLIIGACEERQVFDICEKLTMAIYRYRLERTFKWGISTNTSVKMVIHEQLRTWFAKHQCDLIEIALSEVIETIIAMFETFLEFSTWDVLTIRRYNDDAILENHGDYRILKFEARMKTWKPEKVYAEEIVHAASLNQLRGF